MHLLCLGGAKGGATVGLYQNGGYDESGYLMDTCLTAQDRFKVYLDYFRISYPTE